MKFNAFYKALKRCKLYFGELQHASDLTKEFFVSVFATFATGWSSYSV